MAETQVTTGYLAGLAVWQETDLENVAKQIKVGAAKVYAIDVDSADAAIVYVKGYFKTLGDVVVGTTAPDFILAVPATSRKVFMVTAASPVEYPTALTLACVTTPGTPGTTAPTGAVVVRVSYQ